MLRDRRQLARRGCRVHRRIEVVVEREQLAETGHEMQFAKVVGRASWIKDSADLAQETFVLVYQNRAKFRPDAKFSTWLYTIASNLVKTRYRFRSRHAEVSLDAEIEQSGHSFRDSLPEHTPTPSDRLQTDAGSSQWFSAALRPPPRMPGSTPRPTAT